MYSVERLKTEYLSEPLGIDVASPWFSWQMGEHISKSNIAQKRYQITFFKKINLWFWYL